MTPRRCIELTAVYDDGSMERWEHDAAAHVVDLIDIGMYESEGHRAWDDLGGKTSAPLRKVTTVVSARLCGNLLGSHGERVMLSDLMPDGCEFVPCDYRITVEAVPKEEVPR